MAIQSSFYSGTALDSRTFPSTKHIATKQHMSVWRKQIVDGVWVQMPIGDYQLINNACILNTLLSTSLYSDLEVRVADEVDELITSPSDTSIVAGIANQVEVVAGIAEDVSTVGGISVDVVTTASLEAEIKDIGADPLRQSIIDAKTNADNAKASATTAQLKSWEAEAEKMTSDSYATEPEDVLVKIYTSVGDGTFTSINSTEYSAFHWSKKAEAIGDIAGLTVDVLDLKEANLTKANAMIGLGEQVGQHSTRVKRKIFSRVGELVKTTGSIPFEDCIKANGKLLLRDDYPLLWEFANNSGNITDEKEWSESQKLSYSYGDGLTTFRVPDWRGEFERAWDDGKGIDTNRLLGSSQNDTVISHKHELDYGEIFAAGTNRWGAYPTYKNGLASSGIHSFGNKETRPRNGAVLYCIKYK